MLKASQLPLIDQSRAAGKPDVVRRPLRIVIHDFIGHPFQVQLSRELARRGHSVLHLHCPAFETPKGRLELTPDDPPTLRIQPVSTGSRYRKYNPVTRLAGERRYARTCGAVIREFQPDVVMSGNATPILQNWLRTACQRDGICFVAWMQDLWAMGVAAVCRRRLGKLGDMVAYPLRLLDEALMTRSNGVVFISEDFSEAYKGLRGRARGPWTVVENWAPLDELPTRSKSNTWSRANGLDDKIVLLYSGTLGLKHNPEILARLAAHFRTREDVVVAVITQGLGRTYLERRKQELDLPNLRLFGYQPFEQLPDVIASGDVLLAIIEKEASLFSVPSKVLSYLCASRPLLLSVPGSNLTARIVTRNQAGIVVEPSDIDAFLGAAQDLVSQPDRAASFAGNARAYAQSAFRIEDIADRFEAVFRDCLDHRERARGSAARSPICSGAPYSRVSDRIAQKD